MAKVLLTEDGKIIMAETVAGIVGVSSLNDISAQTIEKETFATDPVTRGWKVGTEWEWDSDNERMKIV